MRDSAAAPISLGTRSARAPTARTAENAGKVSNRTASGSFCLKRRRAADHIETAAEIDSTTRLAIGAAIF